MGAFHASGSPLEDLHNRAVCGLAGGDVMVGDQALGARQRNVLAGKLQQVSFLAGLWLVGDDDDGGAGVGLHSTASPKREDQVSFVAVIPKATRTQGVRWHRYYQQSPNASFELRESKCL